MCWHCENEYTAWRGSTSLVRELYVDAPTGGNLHIVTDDWNLEDPFIRWSISQPGTSDLERNIGRRLLALTEEERGTALKLADVGESMR